MIDKIFDYISVPANRNRIRYAIGVFVMVGGTIFTGIMLVAISLK